MSTCRCFVFLFFILGIRLSAQIPSHIVEDTSRSIYKQQLTNAFSTYRATLFDVDQYKVGFNYHPYFLQRKFEVPNYTFEKPIYTQLNYQSFGKPNQQISVWHNQPITKYGKIKIFYQNKSSEGFYLNERVGVTDLDITSTFSDSLQKNTLIVSFQNRKHKADQNGGISTGVFQNFTTPLIIKRNVNTRLEDANRLDKVRKLSLNYHRDIKSMTLHFDHHYTRNIHQYTHTPAAFANNFLEILQLNSYTNLSDSIRQSTWTAKWYVANFLPKDSIQQMCLGVKNTLLNLREFWLDSLGAEQTFVGLKNRLNTSVFFRYNVESALSFLAQGEHVLAGFNTNDFKYHASLSHLKSNLSAKVNIISQRPSELFYNNHNAYFNYTNALNQQSIFDASLLYNIKGLKAELSHASILQYTYFNEAIQANQANVNVSRIQLGYQREFFKHLYLKINGFFQQASNEIQLPSYAVNGALYYYFKLFKKSLPMTLGVIGNFSEEYLSNTYHPLLNSWTYQDNIFSGGYPLVDFYADIHLTNATLFLRVDHINQGIYPFELAYQTPYFPVNERVLKFGVKWEFFN